MRNIVRVLKNSDPKNIVVIGDLMLDEYVMGVVKRISPEAPVPVLREENYELSFGGAANVAINCKHVGCNVHVIGFIGAQDRAGEKLLTMFANKRIGKIRITIRIGTKINTITIHIVKSNTHKENNK